MLLVSARPISRTVGRATVLFSVLALAAASCGRGQPTAATPLRTAPEPAVSPPARSELPGTVTAMAGTPEGVAITESGLIAVNVRNPDGLVIVPAARIADVAARRFVPLAGSARHLTLAGPDGPALVAEETSDELVEVNLTDASTIQMVPVGRQPHEAFEVGDDQWVANEFGNSFSVVSGGRVIRTVAAPLQPGGGTPSTDDRFVVGVGVRARRITEYRADGSVIGSANCGAGPTHVVSGSGGLFWVNDTNGDAVLAFTLTRHGPRQMARVPVGAGSKPYGIAYDPVHHVLLTTLTGRDQLLELTLRGTTVLNQRVQETVRQPNTVAVQPATGRIVVTGSTANGHLQLLSE